MIVIRSALNFRRILNSKQTNHTTMSLSSLTKLTSGSLPGVTAYNPVPRSQYSNPTSPETEVSFAILGYLSSNANVMVFQVSDAINTGSSLTIDNSQSTNAIAVADTAGQNRQTESTYYSVDFGFDTSANDWSMSFNINLKDGTTGSWVFTKKKVGDEHV
jgi:hypothetical protein